MKQLLVGYRHHPACSASAEQNVEYHHVINFEFSGTRAFLLHSTTYEPLVVLETISPRTSGAIAKFERVRSHRLERHEKAAGLVVYIMSYPCMTHHSRPEWCTAQLLEKVSPRTSGGLANANVQGWPVVYRRVRPLEKTACFEDYHIDQL